MSVQNSLLVRDNSTLANFKQWAQAISSFFSTAGWLQSGDTGQVNWSTISSVPAVNTFVYEIWQPNDGLTNFFLKVEYGTNSVSSNTGPSMRFSVGAGTNGAGTLTGFNMTTGVLPPVPPNVTSTSTQWNCYFSGAPGRMNLMLWRDETSTSAQIYFGIQRSFNSSGVNTSAHVTIVAVAAGPSNNDNFQQSLVFSAGVGNSLNWSAGSLLVLRNYSINSESFNGSIPVSPVFPDVGFFDNPLDMMAVGAISDFTEGAQYTLAAANMPYGASHNYIASKSGVLARVGNSIANSCLLMRYD